VPVRYSVSTWQQHPPAQVSHERSLVIELVAQQILVLGDQRVRVAVDGRTASGKTSFGHELAEHLDAIGRPVLRATLDDFKKPWADRERYDRTSGEGYYRNAYDYGTLRRLLLQPHRSEAAGSVALCSIDPLTQQDHSSIRAAIEPDSVLIVDGVFAFRPEINDYWDLRIWLDVPEGLSVKRGTERDRHHSRPTADPTHERYLMSERIYIREVGPSSLADLVIDNSVFTSPRLVRS
jgi:uridine kinase